ncbi:uncharacterized protein [Bactrocera oleae]|uniref:uncharacterized protein n=1 Tax=Bactrocera oleae TaxID=104688 RepID=UPI00387E6726
MSSLTSTDNRRMSNTWSHDSPQLIKDSTSNVSTALNLPQPPEHWLLGKAEGIYKEERNEDDLKIAKKTNTFDYYNLKKLLYINNYRQHGDRRMFSEHGECDSPQPSDNSSNSSETSTLPQPPQHWLIDKAEYVSKAEGIEEEREMARKMNTLDYYNLKKLLYVVGYEGFGDRNSPRGNTSNVSMVSTLPQPPRHWLIGKAECGCKEEGSAKERAMARHASTFDFYNLKMLLIGE